MYGTVQAPLLDRRRLGGRTRFEKRVASIKASMLRQEKPPRLALTRAAWHLWVRGRTSPYATCEGADNARGGG